MLTNSLALYTQQKMTAQIAGEPTNNQSSEQHIENKVASSDIFLIMEQVLMVNASNAMAQ